jgi:tetratricopeptide (TPR) repeat protein
MTTKRRVPIRKHPADPPPVFDHALDLHRQGELAGADALYQAVPQSYPRYADALNLRGLLRLQQGRPADAVGFFTEALNAQPANATLWSSLGLAQSGSGNCAAALASFDRALALKPDYAEALNSRGNVLRELRRPEEALGSYDHALALKPDFAEAFNNRGNALRDLRRPEDALASYDAALALSPTHVEAIINRGNALRDLRRPGEALACYDRALLLRPSSAEAHNNRGNALRDLARTDEALASYEKAIAFNSDYALAHDNKAVALIELGRFDDAGDAIETSLDLAPTVIHAYYDLTLLPRCWSLDQPHLRAMERLAQDMASLSRTEQIELHFALAKALDRAGAPERAFPHLLAGNTLKRRQIDYDEAAALGALDRVRATYTAERIRRGADRGAASDVPVFILGMPRSGTTLVEQILASHPAVFGAGEIEDFTTAAAPFGAEAIAQASDEDLHRIGTVYLDRIRTLAPSAARITNKTPENFRLAGLIHLALPNARIIHTRRDPVDTCLSCFCQLFAGDLRYTYGLDELGRYYRAYDALMAHWRAVLPPAAFLEVQYESVVADLEGEARRIVSHCGLDWDPRCLDFHRTQRPVRTASMAQVRHPLYRHSVGHWRVYERFLDPLLDALGPLAGRN